MPTKKRVMPPSVQMYFSQDTLEVFEDLKQVAKVTGLSRSDVAYVAFVTGFYQVKEGLLKHQQKPIAKKSRR